MLETINTRTSKPDTRDVALRLGYFSFKDVRTVQCDFHETGSSEGVSPRLVIVPKTYQSDALNATELKGDHVIHT